MNANAVPYMGIIVTLCIYALGVVLNYFVPSKVFEIVLNIASLGILSTWGFIVVCQMKFREAVKRGEVEDVSFKMPLAPFTSWLTLAFLFCVLVLMGFDFPDGTAVVACIPILAILLVAGWYSTRRHRMNAMSLIPSVILTQNAQQTSLGGRRQSGFALNGANMWLGSPRAEDAVSPAPARRARIC